MVYHAQRSTRRFFPLLVLILILGFAASPAGEGTAEAGSRHHGTPREAHHAKRAKAKASKSKRSRAARRRRARKRAAAARRARRRRLRARRRHKKLFHGHAAARDSLRTEPWEKPSGEVWLHAPNLREEVRLNIYDQDGKLSGEALAKLDHIFRCKRTGVERAADPRLAIVLSMLFDHFEGKRVELVSEFRFQRNEGSRHFHASAMDVHIPGVSDRELRDFAASLDRGNMGIGIYPNSGFVHIDFRAPGDPSYRWTDYSGPGTGTKGGAPSRKWKRRQPGS